MAAITFPKEKELSAKILPHVQSTTQDIRGVLYPRFIKAVAGKTLEPQAVAEALYAQFAQHTVKMEHNKRRSLARHLRSILIHLFAPDDILALLEVQKKMKKQMRGLEKGRPYGVGLS